MRIWDEGGPALASDYGLVDGMGCRMTFAGDKRGEEGRRVGGFVGGCILRRIVWGHGESMLIYAID